MKHHIAPSILLECMQLCERFLNFKQILVKYLLTFNLLGDYLEITI